MKSNIRKSIFLFTLVLALTSCNRPQISNNSSASTKEISNQKIEEPQNHVKRYKPVEQSAGTTRKMNKKNNEIQMKKPGETIHRKMPGETIHSKSATSSK